MSRLKDTDILGEVYDPINKSLRKNVRLSEFREFIFGIKETEEKKPVVKVKKVVKNEK